MFDILLMSGNGSNMQTGIEPEFILFFDCPEEEMEKRILSRNQVKNLVGCFVMCLKSATCMGILPWRSQ
jgi:hypothetical protein